MPSPEPEEAIDEEVAELRQELETSPEADPALPDSLGERIHAYAAANLDGRAGFDLAGMPDDVALALLSLSKSQLARLALAGPMICGRWARGEKTGLVGVPFPDTAEPPAPVSVSEATAPPALAI